jgi:hypothetical protein
MLEAQDELAVAAVAACSVESGRWPPLRPVPRACLLPPRRRAWHPWLLAGAVAFGVIAAAALSFTYQRAGTFTAWGLASGYARTGQRLLAAGQPRLAVPFLLAARQHGGESAALHALFRAATQIGRAHV